MLLNPTRRSRDFLLITPARGPSLVQRLLRTPAWRDLPRDRSLTSRLGGLTPPLHSLRGAESGWSWGGGCVLKHRRRRTTFFLTEPFPEVMTEPACPGLATLVTFPGTIEERARGQEENTSEITTIRAAA